MSCRRRLGRIAAFGSGQQTLYNTSLIAQAEGLPRGQTTVEVSLPHVVSRGAIELRENLTMGQAISNYTVEYGSDAAGSSWDALTLRNEG